MPGLPGPITLSTGGQKVGVAVRVGVLVNVLVGVKVGRQGAD